jgi:histidyl-tRNA synthetase
METEKVSFGKYSKPDVFLVAIGDKAKDLTSNLLLELRSKNIKAEYNPDKESLKAQMKAADKENASVTLILGEDEIAANSIVIKEMKTGEQQEIRRNELIAFLQNKLKIK